jgi:GGDEF domain-containing protein
VIKGIIINKIEQHGSTSIGVTVYCDSLSEIAIIKHADTAMYQVKKAGRNTVRSYDPNTQALLEWQSEKDVLIKVT